MRSSDSTFKWVLQKHRASSEIFAMIDRERADSAGRFDAELSQSIGVLANDEAILVERWRAMRNEHKAQFYILAALCSLAPPQYTFGTLARAAEAAMKSV